MTNGTPNADGLAAAHRFVAKFPASKATVEYTADLVEIFSQYDGAMHEALLDCEAGLPRHHKFLPSISEVMDFIRELESLRESYNAQIERLKNGIPEERPMPPLRVAKPDPYEGDDPPW